MAQSGLQRLFQTGNMPPGSTVPSQKYLEIIHEPRSKSQLIFINAQSPVLYLTLTPYARP